MSNDIVVSNNWRNFKIGHLPLPIYIILAAIIYYASIWEKLPSDMIGGIAVMMIMGMLLGDIGLKLPILRNIGGAAILTIFVPSCMVFYGLINPATIKAITAFTKTANFLYFYIACLVTGSILGMVRQVLIQGFIRMVVPVSVGIITASVIGVSIGTITGIGAYKSFFFIVIPVLSGGVGEGILPLSVAYSEILKQSPDNFIAMLVPAAMMGNVFAIMAAGYLKNLGEKRPHLSGNGVLVKSGENTALGSVRAADKPFDLKLMGAGLILACCFYIFGQLLSLVIPIPAAIIMILSAAIVKVLGIMPTEMETGAFQMYKFISTNLTWPLLIAVGVAYTPWQQVVSSITPAYVLTILGTVFGVVISGFFVGKYMNMYPIEAATITCCNSGLGGTGDVAILSAANRVELMPFAQITTRIGGACTVVLATIILRIVSN